MNENEFAVAIFALFFTGYVLIKLIFAVPRTSGVELEAFPVMVDGKLNPLLDLLPEDADIDTTYHYNEDGVYEPDWAHFDEVNKS